jgi:hypothetical protein
MKLAQCFLCLLLAARAVPAAGLVLTDFLPPDTKVVFGIRMHEVAVSALARALTAQVPDSAAVWLKTVSLPGFDPLRDIDEALFATSGAGQNPPVIVVVSGRFDVSRLAQGARRYHDVPMLGGEKDTDSVVALLDGSTAVAGDPAMVRAAIDRRDGGAGIDAALDDRINSLRQRYDVWGLGDRLDGFVTPMPEAKALESIDRFQFGMLLGSGLELGAEVHARSAQDAEKLCTAFEMVAAMLNSKQPPEAASRLEMQVDDDTIKLTLSIPEEELKKTIQTETAALSPATAPPSAPGASAVSLGNVDSGTAAPAVVPDGALPALAAPVVAPAAPTELPQLASKNAASQVLDKEGNTVILQLPGKK